MAAKKLYNNPLSRFAAVMSVMIFVITALLLMLDYFGVSLNPIIGMMTYTLLPGALLFWLLLITLGIYLEWRRRRKAVGEEEAHFPIFDFNVESQRKQLYVFILGIFLVGLLLLAVSFRAYEFTESVHFCGGLCHKVMTPEATTYKNSPHARVACVECHVGKGATWYVKSKLAGLNQVYKTLFNKYPRPIETPVEHLRPAAETCEQCHWPAKFYGAKQLLKLHYQSDELNTPRQFFMLLNVGGGVSAKGIHWHVGQDEVYYVARDKARQDIPWIKIKYKDGRETIFVDSENPPTGEEIARAEVRRMDCVDCHNRPAHTFDSPRQGIDEAITAGKIDRSLPYIKKIGLEVVSKDYSSKPSALQNIRDGVLLFYKEQYPAFAVDKAGLIEKAIGEFQKIWEDNNFPGMKSSWSVYPDNLGHLIWPGCFRCHSGRHKNDEGKIITRECNACHLFLSEKLSGIMSAETALGKPFEHPVDVGGEEMKNLCYTCHQSN